MFKKVYDLTINYNLDNVLEMTDCHKEHANYNMYRETLLSVITNFKHAFKPVGYVKLETSDRYKSVAGSFAILCMVSIGDEIDKIVKEQFATHNYLEGMLLNSLADEVLFEATNQLHGILDKDIKEGVFDNGDVSVKSLFMTSRFETGTSIVPIEWQKDLYDDIQAVHNTSINITSGLMLDPSKSLAYLYGLTKEDCSKGFDHDCSECDSISCRGRKYIIEVIAGDQVQLIQGRKNENLLEVLRSNKLFVDAPCGGKKLCGKCKVKAPGHGYELCPEERGFLTEVEIEEDVILSCFHLVEQDMTIDLGNHSVEGHSIEVGFKKPTILDRKPATNGDYGIAVDIGTTTVATALIDLSTGDVLGVERQLNPQKAYGADVVSRIMHVSEHGIDGLTNLIKDTIESMSEVLIERHDLSVDQVGEMAISGNTTMLYLLLGIDPAPLAVAPFTTIDFTETIMEASKLFRNLKGFNIKLMPFISAYVGGDIVSGLMAVDISLEKRKVLFIDIGTNGEMALFNEGKMITAATAAGPAFEGANIKCGTGSIKGAICEIKVEESGYSVKLLGEEQGPGLEPIGICGSALIDSVAILHQQGFVEDSGFMAEPVTISGDIAIHPEDIRQVQLAKAAIKAGADVLIEEANLTYDEIDCLYIAGGFGKHIDITNSAHIGLIPKELADKVEIIGNSSLAGSIKYLMEKNREQLIEDILKTSEYIELSTNLKFNEAYIMGMMFGGTYG